MRDTFGESIKVSLMIFVVTLPNNFFSGRFIFQYQVQKKVIIWFIPH